MRSKMLGHLPVAAIDSSSDGGEVEVAEVGVAQLIPKDSGAGLAAVLSTVCERQQVIDNHLACVCRRRHVLLCQAAALQQFERGKNAITSSGTSCGNG